MGGETYMVKSNDFVEWCADTFTVGLGYDFETVFQCAELEKTRIPSSFGGDLGF